MSAPGAHGKLRATCDACSAAKVKCDRKQPACDRCRTNSFTCSYSPSRRHGKHAWKRYSEHGLTPQAMTPAPEPVINLNGGDGLGGGTGSGRGSGGREGEPFFDFDALGDGFEVHSDSTDQALGMDLRSGPGTSNSLWNGETSIPTDISISEPLLPRTPSFDSEAEAFSALHSLHICTMLHTDRPGLANQTPARTYTRFGEVTDRMPPLDKVLYFNRAAISTLQELLDAPSS